MATPRCAGSCQQIYVSKDCIQRIARLNDLFEMTSGGAPRSGFFKGFRSMAAERVAAAFCSTSLRRASAAFICDESTHARVRLSAMRVRMPVYAFMAMTRQGVVFPVFSLIQIRVCSSVYV
jgi:hypothetical protein